MLLAMPALPVRTAAPRRATPSSSLEAGRVTPAISAFRPAFGTARSSSCAVPLQRSAPQRRVSADAQHGDKGTSKAPSDPLLAPLPQWCQRLAGAFLLVPFLVFGGAQHANAAAARTTVQDAQQPAAVRSNPLYETSRELSKTPQARAAVAVATAMVGYGLVRSSMTTSPAGRGSIAAGAGAVAVLDRPAPRALPLTSKARTERLDELAEEIEKLKLRNAEVWEMALRLMEQDSTLTVAAATVKAAERMGVDQPAEVAAAALAANSRTAELLASGAATPAELAAPLGEAAAARAAASVAASVAAAAAAAQIPARPSGGAGRGAPGALDSPIGTSFGAPAASSPTPERPGGASARSGPAPSPATPTPSQGAYTALPIRPGGASSRGGPTPTDARAPSSPAPERPGGASARAGPPAAAAATASPGLAAWANDVVQKAAVGTSGSPGRSSLRNPSFDPPSSATDSNFMPSARPTRRAPQPPRPAQQQLQQQPPPLPLPPKQRASAPTSANPSFAVSDESPSPEAFLASQAAEGRTADGRVNPSFAAPSATAGAAPAAPEAPAPQWYNPLSWFAQRSRDERSGINPSFDASMAVDQQQLQKPVSLVDAVLDAASAAPAAADAGASVKEAPAAAVKAEAAPAAAKAAPAPAPGMGAAAAASSAAWSTALRSGPAHNDFGPVEQVTELLQVATRTEEYKHPKYDPLRNVLSDAAAPSAAHKYDMLRGLLRSSNSSSPARQRPAAPVAEGQQQQEVPEQRPADSKYDLLYDLLRSLKTSGEPEAILASTDPKYDPVWALLNSTAPTGTVSKYDMVGSLLKAALAASPQPSRYDPLQALLKAEPITGSYKYCLAEVVLRGGWQQSLQEGLKDLPAWDPMANVVGARAASASPSARRPPSKYDMVGVALEGMAALPEELASGKWAEKQPVDPIVGRAARPSAPRRRQAGKYGKYDMVGAALASLSALPEELASGRFSAANGRELLVDTVERTMEEGGWGLLARVRRGGAAVAGAVGSVGNMVKRAVGVPVPEEEVRKVWTEVKAVGGSSSSSRGGSGSGSGAVGVKVVEQRPAGGGGKVEEGTPVLFQFSDVPSKREEERRKKREHEGRLAANVSTGAPADEATPEFAEAAAVAAVFAQPGNASPLPSPPASTTTTTAATVAASAPSVSPSPTPAPTPSSSPAPTARRLERAVVPPLRGKGARYSSSSSSSSTTSPSISPIRNAKAAISTLPFVDPDALFAALEESGSAAAATSSLDVVDDITATAAADAAIDDAPPPPTLVVPAGLKLNDLAVDLLVLISVQGSRGGPMPDMDALIARFGPGFADVAEQVYALRSDARLLSRHPAIARLVATAAASQASGTPDGADRDRMWSQLYEMLGAVRGAEQALGPFLKDARAPYPLVHGLLTTGDAGQGVSVLCALCSMVPLSSKEREERATKEKQQVVARVNA